MPTKLKITFATMFVMSMALISLAISPFGRAMTQGNTYNCYWHLYSNTPEDVRIIATGTSRIRRSIVLADLEEALGYPTGSAANFAHAGVSPYFDYGLIDHITAHQDIDLILFEVWPQSLALRELEIEINPPGNFDGRLQLDQKDLLYKLGLPLKIQMEHIQEDAPNPLHASWKITQLLRDRVAEAIPMMLSIKRIKNTLYSSISLRNDGRYECYLNIWDDPKDRIQNGSAKQKKLQAKFKQAFAPKSTGSGWVDPDPLGYIHSKEFAGERRILHKVVKLAKERNTDLVFIYKPSIHVPIAYDSLAAAFKAEFGAPLIYPDSKTREILLDGGFSDNNHLNTKGRAIYGPWFAKAVAKALLRREAQE